MNHRLFSEDDCQEYLDEHPEVKFIKVHWEQESACWLVHPDQIKGHEFHYAFPQSEQYLPYNIVFKDGKEMPHPRAMFSEGRLPRTTLT